MNNNIEEIYKILHEMYPEIKCSLDFSSPLELAVAVQLAAQCTDERVNRVTKILFERCKTLEDYIEIPLLELDEIIYSCGFHSNKAKHIKRMCEQIKEEYDGELPTNIDKLTGLSGIGRKSANVIATEAYGMPQGIAVDTHVSRISRLLKLSSKVSALAIEKDLLEIIPNHMWQDINMMLVQYGRDVCNAKSPKCSECKLIKYCMKGDQNEK